MTGKNPGKHGVYGFTDVKPGTISMYFPNFGNVRGDTLWDVAGRAGKRCLVIEHSQHVSGAPAGRHARLRLRGREPGAGGLSGVAAAAALNADGYKIDVDYVNADQRPDHFFTDLDATLEGRRRTYLRLLREEPWDLFVGVITECDRLHHYFWNQYVDPGAPHHQRFLDFYRRLDDVLGEMIAALPADVAVFVVADHGHTLIHQEFFPNAWLRQQGLLRFTSEKPKGPADIDPSSKVFVLDPGRVYLHRKGRFPMGTVEDAEAADLLGSVREGLLALRDRARARPPAGVRCRASSTATSCTTAPASTPRPDLVIHFNDGYDPKGAMARTEVFGRSALTGMHTLRGLALFREPSRRADRRSRHHRSGSDDPEAPRPRPSRRHGRPGAPPGLNTEAVRPVKGARQAAARLQVRSSSRIDL